MAKNFKKRSPKQNRPRTIERRRLSKTLSDRRPPPLRRFCRAAASRPTAKPPAPLPCGTRLFALFLVRSRVRAESRTQQNFRRTPTKRSDRVYFPPSAVTINGIRNVFEKFRQFFFRLRRRLPPDLGCFRKKFVKIVKNSTN